MGRVMIRRGDVYDVRLDPTEGSEQAGSRPVIIVSRNAISAASPVVLAVPCTTYRSGRRMYPSHLLVRAPGGGLEADSVALTEQTRALARTRLGHYRGALSPQAMVLLEHALLIALDLDRLGG